MDYDLIASDYDKDITRDLDPEKLRFEMIELTGITDPNAWSLLDLGCGSGVQMNFLASNFPGISHLEGIDSSEELVSIATTNRKDERCTYRVGDMHGLPYGNDEFDFVYSRYTIHYSTDVEKVIREIYRVTKPNGQAFIQIVHPIYELFKKPSKDYGNNEEAVFTPQTTDVEVKHATHTVAEYINASLVAGFIIKDIEERFGGQSEIKNFRVPTILILRLRKT